MQTTKNTSPSYEILLAQNQELRAENLQQKERIDAQEEIISELKCELGELRRLIFGSKRERFIPEDEAQLGLGFDDREREAAQEHQQITYQRRKAKKATPHARGGSCRRSCRARKSLSNRRKMSAA